MHDRLPVFYFISNMVPGSISNYLELQRLHPKIHRSRTVQIHHVPWLPQCLDMRSKFSTEKQKKANINNKNRWKIELAQHYLEPARCQCTIPRPIHSMFSFTFFCQLTLTLRAQLLVFLFGFRVFFFVSFFEQARYCWANPFQLSEPAKFATVFDRAGSLPNKFRLIEMVNPEI